MQNPLLDTDTLPEFSRIRPEHVEPAIDDVLADNRRRLAELCDGDITPTWQGLLAPLEAMNDRLDRVWSPVAHLNAVMNNDALREAFNACLPKLSAYATELAHNRTLYEAFRSLRESAEFAALTTAQRFAVEHALRDFRMGGVGLPEAEKARFAAASQRLSELGALFQDQLLDAGDAWHWRITDKARLRGLPESTMGLLAREAERNSESGWRLTLAQPVVQAVLTYADDRELRRTVYEAWNTRASEIGPNAGTYDNLPAMTEILALRHEQAQLLGFDHYAAMALEPRMASTPDAAIAFLEDLAERALPKATEELAELQRFAYDEDGLEALQAWDVGYYAEKLRQARFQLSPEDLRPYLPADRVLRGLFDVAERLYELRIGEVGNAEVWHPDVRFYEIRDADGTLRGQFYADLYARPQKRGGAWMAECRARFRGVEGLQVPVAFLTCNFTPAVGEATARLTHEEVQTLFHEFGHGLHHMLTAVDVPSVSGIRQVPWDGVELPSQLMENWTWERAALDRFAAHHQTGEPLPAALFERMRAARNFQAGMQMARQLEFSLFDLRLHLEPEPPDGERIYAILRAVREQVAVVDYPAFNRFPNGFQHIFAGGYAAGYYSYKWAEVLAADAYSRFEAEGIFNADTGQAFRDHILAQGGAGDFAAMYRNFRGREPSIEALLRQHGLAA